MTVLVPASNVLFDADGVLIDSDDSVRRAWGRWAEDQELAPETVLAYVHGRRSADTVARFVPEDDRIEAQKRIDAYELQDARLVSALPGALDLLQSLSATWAIVTSAVQGLAIARLSAAGLPRPRVLVTADDVVRGKPAPDGYLLAASRLGISPREAVVFEDADAGIAAARAAGVGWVVGVGPRSLGRPVDVRIGDLRSVRHESTGLIITPQAT